MQQIRPDRPDFPWLAGLNEAQRRAAGFGQRAAVDASFDAGPLLVIAGAGTGKTSTIAHRVAHLVANAVDPSRILLITFSRRAALEMTRRAQRLAARAFISKPIPEWQSALASSAGRITRSVTSQTAMISGQEMLDSPPAIGPRSSPQPGGQVELRLPWAGTFHSIAARLLRQYAAHLGLPPQFGILDRSDAADLLDLIRHEQGLSDLARRFPRKDTCLAIYSRRVNSGWSLERVLQQAYPWCLEWAVQLGGLYREYVVRKQANGLLDYDDLLLWWEAAMADPVFAARIGSRFDHVLVDEYQDTNTLQARILLAIKPDGKGLMVVGDDAQSIYAFRAADVGNILEFPERFSPPAQRITLEENYRSLQPVLNLANALIGEGARQYPKTLRATRAGGQMPRLVTVLDDRAQADWVIAQVLAQREAGVALRRQAVLFRSAHHSDLLEIELTRRNIPYVKHGGLRFLEAAHVKDLIAVLRWAHNPRDALAAFRVLQLHQGMGPANAHRCLAHLSRAWQGQARGPAADQSGQSPSDDQDPKARATATEFIHGSSFEALAGFTPPPAAAPEWADFVALMSAIGAGDVRWQGQLEQIRRWYQPVLERRHDDAAVRAADLDMLELIGLRFGSREQFLTELALDPPQATGDLAGEPLRDEDYLILSTVHTAKGQEWDAVYLLNVADGNFPNEYATGDPVAIEEERRLLYVAITRARDTLQLIEPMRYYVTGQARHGAAHVHGARSRFLSSAVLACLEQHSPPLGDAFAGSQPGTGAEDGLQADEQASAGGTHDPSAAADGTLPSIDIARRMLSMW